MFFLALLLSNLLMGSFSTVQGCDNPVSGALSDYRYQRKVTEACQQYSRSRQWPKPGSKKLLALAARARLNDIDHIITPYQAASESEQQRVPASMASVPVAPVTQSSRALMPGPSTLVSSQTDREFRELDALHPAASLERRQKELIQAISEQNVENCRELLETTSPDFSFYWSKFSKDAPIYSNSEYTAFNHGRRTIGSNFDNSFESTWLLEFAYEKTQDKKILRMLVEKTIPPLNSEIPIILPVRWRLFISKFEHDRDIIQHVFPLISSNPSVFAEILKPRWVESSLLKMAFDNQIGVTDDAKKLILKNTLNNYFDARERNRDSLCRMLKDEEPLKDEKLLKDLEIFLLAGFLTSDTVEQKVSILCPWYNTLDKESQSYPNVQFDISLLRQALENIELRLRAQENTYVELERAVHDFESSGNNTFSSDMKAKIVAFVFSDEEMGSIDYSLWLNGVEERLAKSKEKKVQQGKA